MNIKQSIASLIILLGVLFSAFNVSAAQPTYSASDVAAYPNCNLSLGKRVNPYSYVSCYENKFVNYKDFYTKSCSIESSKFALMIICNTTSPSYPRYHAATFLHRTAKCPADHERIEDGDGYTCEPIVPACEFGENPDGTCMDACQFKQSIDDKQSLHWSAYVYGEQVTGACYGDFGATRCELERIPNDTTLCTDVDSGEFTQNTRCHGKFQFTGNQCDGGTLFWGKDGPDTPIIPDDPIHDPDDPTGDIEDPSVLPDGSTNTVNPPDTDAEPEVEDPDTDESTDKGVVSAIKGLNSDVNKALNALNVDLNQSSADIQNQIIALNASMVTNTQAIQKQQINDNKIYENT
uniref:methyl-accepting chemotaxis protein n=2 Tax=Vibrionaceae TaxID=641 RepID=UPI001E3E2F07